MVRLVFTLESVVELLMCQRNKNEQDALNRALDLAQEHFRNPALKILTVQVCFQSTPSYIVLKLSPKQVGKPALKYKVSFETLGLPDGVWKDKTRATELAKTRSHAAENRRSWGDWWD